MALSTDRATVAEGFADRVRALEEAQLDERSTRSYPARPRGEDGSCGSTSWVAGAYQRALC